MEREKTQQKVKSPRKSRGLAWKNSDVRQLLEVMQEETILYSLDNANTPNAKRVTYRDVQVQLQNKGKFY